MAEGESAKFNVLAYFASVKEKWRNLISMKRSE